MTREKKKRRKKKRGWPRYWPRLLFLIPFIAMLWVPSYNQVEPELGGIPFFYNEKSGRWICGNTKYEKLKDWALS